MSFETWAAFVLASAMVLVLPGPTVLIVTTSAALRGRRAALPIAGAVTLGYASSLALAALGLSTALATSESLATGLQLAGGAYLGWRGALLWWSGGAPAASSADGLVRQVWLVTASNPVTIAFHLAFLPRFVEAGGEPLRQVAVLAATFLVLGFLNALAYAHLAAWAGRALGSARGQAIAIRTGAAGLIGIGAWVALSLA